MKNVLLNQICAHGDAMKPSWLIIRFAAYHMGNKQLKWPTTDSGLYSLA